jgi:ribosomal-protein-alanine N-acetyltransferase
MSAAPTITDGGLADLATVMAVMNDSFDPRYGEGWTLSQCAGLLPMPGVWLRLGSLEGRAVGFALARIVADEAELLLLAVAPDAQRRGVGRALLMDFIAGASARGAGRLHLEVRDGNPAIRLYEAAGFALAGRRRNYYRGDDGRYHDALTLARISPLGD